PRGCERAAGIAGIEALETAPRVEALETAAGIEALETAPGIEALRAATAIEASGTADTAPGVGRRGGDRRQQNRRDGNASQSSKHPTIPRSEFKSSLPRAPERGAEASALAVLRGRRPASGVMDDGLRHDGL